MPKATKVLLSWPEDDVKSLVEAYAKRSKVVYGAGQYADGMFTVKGRFTNDGHIYERDVVTVPTFYGFHLERLCYLNRYYTLAWDVVIKTFYSDGLFDAAFADAVDVVGRLWMYHLNALNIVIRQALTLKGNISRPDVRISALDEWVIRERYNLALAEEDELLEYLAKDILKDAADLDPDAQSDDYDEREYPPQTEEARLYWFKNDGFLDWDFHSYVLQKISDASPSKPMKVKKGKKVTRTELAKRCHKGKSAKGNASKAKGKKDKETRKVTLESETNDRKKTEEKETQREKDEVRVKEQGSVQKEGEMEKGSTQKVKVKKSTQGEKEREEKEKGTTQMENEKGITQREKEKGTTQERSDKGKGECAVMVRSNEVKDTVPRIDLRLEKRKEKKKRHKMMSMINAGSSEVRSTGDLVDLPVNTSEGKHVRKRGLGVSADMPATKKARTCDVDDDEDQTDAQQMVTASEEEVLALWNNDDPRNAPQDGSSLIVG